MPLAIYKTTKLELVADPASTQSVKDDEGLREISCGMAIFTLHPPNPQEDYDEINQQVTKLCEELCLTVPNLPPRTSHVMMVWEDSFTTAECYMHLVAFDGTKNHCFALENF